MRNQGWRSRLACRHSIDLLFPSMEDAQLFAETPDLPHCWQSRGYLWTFTFPDEKGQMDHRYAMKAWHRVADWLLKSGKRCVRAIERGDRNGHYHFHAVTDQRWNVNEVRARAERAGFGRINVEEIPRARLYYLAKYIGKKGRWKMPKRLRLWACVGFSGFGPRDIKFDEMTLTVPQEDLRPAFTSVIRWQLDGELLRERILRADWTGDPDEVHIMNITKENILHIGQLLSQGVILGVGEYRTCTTRTLTFTNEKTEKKETRKIVEHGLEFGNDQITVSEWLPDDADLSNVKPPVNKGDPVVVEIASFSPKFGITAKSIKSVASFNGKLA